MLRLARRSVSRLQNVQAFDDHHVGPIDDLKGIRHDVVREMGVDGHGKLGTPGLGLRKERDQSPEIVAFGKALAVHDPARLENVPGVEKPVGRHQVNLRVIGPASQQGSHDAGRRAFPDRDAAGQADDEWRLGHRRVQEGGGRPVQRLARVDMEVEQPREW